MMWRSEYTVTTKAHASLSTCLAVSKIPIAWWDAADGSRRISERPYLASKISLPDALELPARAKEAAEPTVSISFAF